MPPLGLVTGSSESAERVARRLKLTGHRAAVWGAPLVPRRVGLRLSGWLGRLAAVLSPAQRRVVESNLRRVLGPDVEPDRLHAATGRVFENSARNYFDFFRLPHLGLDEVAGLTRIHHESRLWDALRLGKGVVLATAHLGSFDVAAQLFAARRVEVLVLVEPLDPPELLDLVAGLRRSHGLRVEAVGPGTLRRALTFLREGKVVVVASDRPIQRRGERIEFFGEPALLPTGAIDLALSTGAALLPAFAVRLPGDRFAVYVEPALPLVRTGNRRHDGRVNLAALRDVLERYIRAYPDQWLIFQPIWPLKGDRRRPGHPGEDARDTTSPPGWETRPSRVPASSAATKNPAEPAPQSARGERKESVTRLRRAEVLGGNC